MRLLQAQKLVQYLRECEDAMDWISDKVRVNVYGTAERLVVFSLRRPLNETPEVFFSPTTFVWWPRRIKDRKPCLPQTC